MVAYQARPRLRNVRTAKHATHLRKTHASRARYTALVRFCGVFGVVLVGVMTYVMLMANLTSLNYAVSRADLRRAALQAETARLDDRLAALRSDDRLAKLAAQLHMREPQQFALVTLPPGPPQGRSRLFLSSIASWFGAK
jgi:biopolymer transport protein ExbB/TolQ